MAERWEPGERFAKALAYAVDKHSDQWRKGSDTPYVAHLLGVCGLVIEDGGSEDEAIAALLHDAAEDQGGETTLGEIEEKFGPDVRRIVAACSDTFTMPKPPWRKRKEDYIAAIPSKRDDELRVSLADKVHNARSILFDFRAAGDEVFRRFSVDRDQTLWYYRSLADEFAQKAPGPMAEELTRVVDDLDQAVT